MVSTTVLEAVRFRPLAMVVRFHLLPTWKCGRVGLSQNPAKIPCQVIGTVGSNPTTSIGSVAESGLLHLS